MSSRTLLWYGCLTGLVSASLLYVAGDHARRHPDSLIARCLRSTCLLTTEYTTVGGAGSLAVQTAKLIVPDTSGHEASEAPAEEAPEALDPAEVIDLSQWGQAEEVVLEPETSEAVTVPPVDVEEAADSVPAIMPPADEPEQLTIMPTLMTETPEEGTQEDSEAMDENRTPIPQMDPHHGHEYPGCPYTGGCPRSSCPPARLPETKPAETKPMPEPSAEEQESTIERKARDYVPSEDDDAPHHSQVDTMEFRKSDAKKGEFKNKPM